MTSTGKHSPEEEEQPTQDKTLHQASSATSSAAQGGTKAAERGEGQVRPNATSQREMRAHVIAARHKRAVSKSARPPTNANAR